MLVRSFGLGRRVGEEVVFELRIETLKRELVLTM